MMNKSVPITILGIYLPVTTPITAPERSRGIAMRTNL